MIIGLDIGTSKVVAIVGEVNPEGEIEIVDWVHTRRADSKKG